MAFPGFEEKLTDAIVIKAPEKVVTDGNITTSRGMGTSIDLGLELVGLLVSEEKAKEVIRGNYGNGEVRKQKLGDQYSEIQSKVNEMYRNGLVK